MFFTALKQQIRSVNKKGEANLDYMMSMPTDEVSYCNC
jgi:hypothetical protein